jgi:hypothetical protein
MTWNPGSNAVPCTKGSEQLNNELMQLEGYLEENEAKIELYNFLRSNITFTVDLVSGVKLFPFQHLAIKSMFETDYFMGVWSRGMSKSFTTGIFAFLDAILNQGVEIGILSKSFRQAKMIFKKIEDIAAKPEAGYLAQCITKKTKSNDEWLMEIGTSRIRALPLGDGDKLRGFRFHRIIIDEFALMPERIYNEVIVPFLSVVENPTEREDLDKAENDLIQKGLMDPKDKHIWPNNKLIMLSSACYKFEYMYKLYEQFDRLINSVAEDPTETKRAIMKFSYDCAPKLLYDQNLIKQAKSSMSQSQFDREFGALFTDDSSGYFKTSTMAACTLMDGEGAHVEVKGDPNSKYLLSFDPSWAESESSDDFAMQVFKLDDEKRMATFVHGYALPGTTLREHIKYFHYLLTNFNIVSVIGDYNGGVQFLSAANESSIFKKDNLEIKQIKDLDFTNVLNYPAVLKEAKNQYNLADKRICFLQKPSSSWIRRANELLQANFDHKRILFAGRAVNDSYHSQRNKKIPIDKLKFSVHADVDKQSPSAKMIDFIEHQTDMVDLTKAECALIQISTSPQGTQTFDMPLELRRQSGPDKPRKDAYSALVLGNWMTKVYYDMLHAKEDDVQVTFTPMFVN